MKKSVTNIVVLYSIFGLVMTQAQEIEEIIVTGSNIGTNTSTVIVEVVDGTDYQNLNITNIGDI